MPAAAVIAFTTDHTVEDSTECTQTHRQTDRHTKVKTVYPPFSGYNKNL